MSACGTKDNLAAATTDINPDLFTTGTGADANNNSFTTGADTDANNNSTVADIKLSWAAPAEREDNSSISLAEIAGYQVFYGQAQGQYPSSITINDGTAVGYTFTDFPAGTYYFVVTTVDSEGRESQFSSEVVIAI